jgi:hypothetical protein
MTTDISQLMSPTLVFMMFCYFLTLGLRRSFELGFPKLKDSTAWTAFLPILPVLVGTVIVFVPKYPIPPAFGVSPYAKAIFGFVAGALSTWAYAIIQAVLKRLFGFDINTFKRSVPPVAGPTTTVNVPPPPMVPGAKS